VFGQPDPIPGLSQGSQTRLANERTQAKQSGLGGNQAAINSLRAVTGPLKKRPKSNVGGYDSSAGAGSSPIIPQSHPQQLQGPAAVATPQYNLGALSAAPNVAAAQPEDPVERYNRTAAINRIVDSPDMMDTVTKLKLRNYFQGRPDEGLGTEALGIVKQMHGIS
jgi:hypothetical protein